MDRDIWRATDQQARAILAEEGIDLTEEETPVLLDHLPFYLDAALKECVLALARQQLKSAPVGPAARREPEWASHKQKHPGCRGALELRPKVSL